MTSFYYVLQKKKDNSDRCTVPLHFDRGPYKFDDYIANTEMSNYYIPKIHVKFILKKLTTIKHCSWNLWGNYAVCWIQYQFQDCGSGLSSLDMDWTLKTKSQGHYWHLFLVLHTLHFQMCPSQVNSIPRNHSFTCLCIEVKLIYTT